MREKFIGRVVAGKIEMHDKQRFGAHLKRFREGAMVAVTVGHHRQQRSLRQNAYYWGAVLPLIAAETGHTAEELHEVFKRMFLPAKVITYGGREMRMPGSTPDTDTKEFTDYLERIRAEAATLGVTVPDPGQVDVDEKKYGGDE